jgi:hypothetical protein
MHVTFPLFLLDLITPKIFCKNVNKEQKMAKLCTADWITPVSMTTGGSANGHSCTELMNLCPLQK